MPLSDEQARQLQSYLMRHRPDISMSDLRESHRIEGEVVDDDRDVRGYRSVVAFIERGLGNADQTVGRVLHRIASVQDRYHLAYSVHLFSYGWDDGKLHHTGGNRLGGCNIDAGKWAQVLCSLAGTEEASAPASIPSLFPLSDPYGSKHDVEKDDLLVFFCRNRDVRMSRSALQRLSRHPAKHAIWFFCDGDSVDMALGGFVPRETESETVPGTTTRHGSSVTPMVGARRGLSRQFMNDLKSGILERVLKVVLADDTLSLNIRAGYINIYYRGGSLLKIKERVGAPGSYDFAFDVKYVLEDVLSSLGLYLPDVNQLPVSVKSAEDALSWVERIPLLKCTMDLWFGRHPKLERELQQLAERMNNGTHATDYFICDIEYTHPTCKELRADMVAIHWPSRSELRKDCSAAKLAIIEMKHGTTAMAGVSGIADHIARLQSAAIDFQVLSQEMVEVFNQRVELGLIRCHTDKNKKRVLGRIQSSPLEYLIVLSDHDPDSSVLLRELEQIPSPDTLGFDIYVATANMMGYGLFDQGICTLGEFRARYSQQICARPQSKAKDQSEETNSAPDDPLPDVEQLIASVVPKPDERMCELCHARPATEYRQDTWQQHRPNPSGIHLCSECSGNFMY